MKIHKLTWVLLMGLLLLSSCSTKQPNIYLSANAAAVYSVENGEPLYEENADKVMPIASLTKLMTAFLVLEAVDNNELSWDEKLRSCSIDDPSAVSFTRLHKRERGPSEIYTARCSLCLQMMPRKHWEIV